MEIFTLSTLALVGLYVLYSVLSLYALWLFYLAVMSLYRAQLNGQLSKLALYLGYPLLAVGLVLDLVVNIFVASVVMLDFPRELTVSEKMSRLIKSNSKWRRTGACWFCEKFLDVFDPNGPHCK